MSDRVPIIKAWHGLHSEPEELFEAPCVQLAKFQEQKYYWAWVCQP